MSDLDYDLSDPTGGAPAPRRKAAPKAAGGVTPEQLQAFIADPTTIPEHGSGMSADQQAQVRRAWPVLDRNTTPESGPEGARVAQLNQKLDTLLGRGESLYRAPLDKKTHRALIEHYDWLKSKERKGEGMGAEAASLLGGADDPLDKLKGDRRARALDAIQTIDLLRTAGIEPGAQSASPLELLTTHIPSPYDAPDVLASKKKAFASQVESLAQGIPSQYWRAAVKHTLRARALAGVPTSGTNVPKVPAAPGAPPTTAAPAATPPDKVAPYGLSGVVTGQTAPAAEDMGLPEAVGRAALHGSTSLSMPVMAAIAHSIATTGDVPLGEGMTQFVPDAVAEQPTSYAQTLDTGRRLIGDDPEKLAQAREEHPKAAFLAEAAGGLADPTTYALGPMGKVIGESTKLSAPARAVLAHAVSGSLAGTLGAAGEGGDAVTGALTGAALGGTLGAGAEHLLNSPAGAKAIKGVVQKFADEVGASSAEVAAKEAALRAAAVGSPEMRAVVSGDKKVAEALGPKLVDARDALLERTKGGALKSMMVKAERAADAGETKAVEAAHAQFRKIAQTAKTPEAKSLATGLDELLTKRELLQQARSGGHGNVSQYGANIHPMATLANPAASGAAVASAAVHEGMVRGPGAIPMLAVAGGRRALAIPARTAKQGLAKLYLARQTGDAKLIHQVVEEAIRVGVPYSIARQVAEQAGQPGDDE